MMRKMVLLVLFALSFSFVNAGMNAKSEPTTSETKVEMQDVAFRTNLKFINREYNEKMYFYTNCTFKVIGSDGRSVSGTYSIEDRVNLRLNFNNLSEPLYSTITYYNGKVTSITFNGIKYLPF